MCMRYEGDAATRWKRGIFVQRRSTILLPDKLPSFFSTYSIGRAKNENANRGQRIFHGSRLFPAAGACYLINVGPR